MQHRKKYGEKERYYTEQKGMGAHQRERGETQRLAEKSRIYDFNNPEVFSQKAPIYSSAKN